MTASPPTAEEWAKLDDVNYDILVGMVRHKLMQGGNMKIEQIKRYTFVGEDFEGTWEPCDSILGYSTLKVDLSTEGRFHHNADGELELMPSASFTSATTESDIDRLCAAAKIALRECSKL